MVTGGYEWVLVVIGGYGWSAGNELLWVVTSGYVWLWVGNGWLPMVTSGIGGSGWLWMVMGW